jgi:hypothetical protein
MGMIDANHSTGTARAAGPAVATITATSAYAARGRALNTVENA